MINGANFDQDAIELFGDPWHGLYRGGVLELPNATTRALAGAAPANGENYKVMIPGQPAVTTDAADTAAGMTWLNHGVMSGKEKRLYGVNLGEMKWIYIDADDSPWLATLSHVGTTATVTLARFGEMEGTPATYSATASLTLPTGTVLKIDDIDSAGRQVALVAFKIRHDEIDGLDWRVCEKIWKLTLSGTAAALSLALSMESDCMPVDYGAGTTGGYIYWLRYQPTQVITGPFYSSSFPGAPPDYDICIGTQSGTFENHVKRAIGATLHNDVFALVFSVTYQYQILTVTHDFSSVFDPYYGRMLHELHETEESGSYYGIEIAGNLTTFPIAWSASRDLPYGSIVIVSPLTICGINVQEAPEDNFQGHSWPYVGDRRIIDQRLGNRAYGAVAYSYDPMLQHVNLGVAGPVSGDIDPYLTSLENPAWATAHHTTGALVVSTSGVVCFV